MKVRTLSARARHALLTAIHGTKIDSNRLGSCVADLNDSSPSEVLAKLRKAPHGDKMIGVQLMMVKGCGAVTAREIIAWLGGPTDVGPVVMGSHECVCRTCGARMS